MKNNKTQKANRASIADVYKLACTDEKFLNALLENSDKALEEAQLDLSKSDRVGLKKLLKKKMKVSGDNFLKFANMMFTADKPPAPDPWLPPGSKYWSRNE